VQQGERMARLEPGYFALVDSATPHVFRFDDRLRSVILQLGSRRLPRLRVLHVETFLR
jgi:hypothetical protein